jgi:hypothetical protein
VVSLSWCVTALAPERVAQRVSRQRKPNGGVSAAMLRCLGSGTACCLLPSVMGSPL